MKLGKHLAGIALFFFIFGSTVIITRYLTAPLATIPPVALDTTMHRNVRQEQQPVNYKVRLVSLDFINNESYTTLSLTPLVPEQSLPKRLWVRTFFFTPERAGRVQWGDAVEIRLPEVYELNSNGVEVAVSASCKWCTQQDTPKSGYFARVFVSTKASEDAYPPHGAIDIDIRSATPVVVQAERKTNAFVAF